jgi:arylsulfatase A-like enzyme
LIGSQEYGYKRNKLRPENVETIKALYDYEIKTTDAYVAEVLAEIRNRPNTLVIISSDHGEEFLEHGFYEHRKTLYEETTRVPLVIAMPARDNASLETVEPDTPISLVDLAPSVLNYLGIEVPTTMDGEPGLLTGDVTADRPVFTVLRTGGEKSLAAVIVKEKKAIMAALPAETSFEYYDLESDPGEQRPLPEDDGFSHLTALLETWFISRTNRPGSVGPESRLPEERKDLKALGYM